MHCEVHEQGVLATCHITNVIATSRDDAETHVLVQPCGLDSTLLDEVPNHSGEYELLQQPVSPQEFHSVKPSQIMCIQDPGSS